MITNTLAATTNPADIHPGLLVHQQEMVHRCPYLRPSVERELTIWSSYTAGDSDQRELFALLVQYAEEVRIARRTYGPLTCRNIAIHGPEDLAAAKALMDWPSWLARNLYAPVQLIVDRFWIGIGRRPETGQSTMPDLPVSFFMVRCAVPNRDRVIVSERSTSELAVLRDGPGDDGRDVFASALGRSFDNPADAWDELTALYPAPQKTNG